ncbi:MAG: anaerobic ribonucleoside-triphosphate reductase, partial [Bifidobacterium crudilactis]|nr:anaerobic ribonucleoside-triphosphate reductase [Bifidobacterium crudilactis]
MESQLLDNAESVVEEGSVDGQKTAGLLVEKRDGRIVDFDPVNIISAVESAYQDAGEEVGPQESQTIHTIAEQVEGEVRDRYTKPVKIEDIQNLVEHALINGHHYEIARSYTTYRLSRDIDRAKATDVNEAVNRLTSKDETLVRENANKDSNVYATQRDLLAGAVSKASALNMLPKEVANAHLKGDIHFHDADYSP